MNDRDIRSAFDNLKSDVMTNVRTDDRLDHITGRSRLQWRPAVAVLSGAAVVALVIGGAILAIQPSGDPDPVPPATGGSTTSIVDTTTSNVAPVLPVPPLGSVVIANRDVVGLQEGDGYIAYLADRVVGDGSGGVVVQIDQRFNQISSAGEGRTIVRASEISSDDGPVTIRLEDSVVIDGSVHVLYLVTRGSFERPYQEVWTYDLDSGASERLYRRDELESNILRVSLAGDTMVVTVAEESNSTYFLFFDAAGRPSAVSNPFGPGRESTDFASPLVQGVLSPDGSTLLYGQIQDVTTGEDGYLFVDLVEWDLAAGVEIRRAEIQLRDGASPNRIDYDGATVVLGRQRNLITGTPALAPLRIESLDDGIVTELGEAGSPSLIKLRVLDP